MYSAKKIMKFILILGLLSFIATAALAQTDAQPSSTTPHILICAPSRGQLIAPPLYIIFSHNKIIYKSAPSVNKIDSSFNQIPPAAIKSINVINSSEAVTKYGVTAKNGAIEIYLDDEHFPNAFRFSKPDTVAIKQK